MTDVLTNVCGKLFAFASIGLLAGSLAGCGIVTGDPNYMSRHDDDDIYDRGAFAPKPPTPRMSWDEVTAAKKAESDADHKRIDITPAQRAAFIKKYSKGAHNLKPPSP